ncbi:uncharacterized protein BO97DRAFT_444819 [Aspergillus homomorphus CBS 101889]|uniref:Zn(2)-C6 fungal-type domain-containing protein n=1 Tax=Aspergillus homomorphus (strain CBS 101889) TaxID=1450537 RepID=A0A395HS14_ASPHC|nr:hypothetical protein BO97DRAFT_444819 [Aspergillus homomorphus CBS 101889]RAL10135.1 hypothetical protein BO97DRAFT_444819 [Aspergillus homomorphus CBS 101889]
MAQQGSTLAYRTLAPKPTSGPSKRRAFDPPEPPDPSLPKNMKGRIKRAPMSCEEFDQGIPCAACSVHGLTCTVNEFSDKRRKTTAIHTLEQAAYYRAFLEQSFRVLRVSDPLIIEAALAIIRNNESHDVIRNELIALVPGNDPILPTEKEILEMIQEEKDDEKGKNTKSNDPKQPGQS